MSDRDEFVAAAWPDLVALAALATPEGGPDPRSLAADALAEVLRDWRDHEGAPHRGVRQVLARRLLSAGPPPSDPTAEPPQADGSAPSAADDAPPTVLYRLDAMPALERLLVASRHQLRLTTVELADLSGASVAEVDTALSDAERSLDEALAVSREAERRGVAGGPVPYAVSGALDSRVAAHPAGDPRAALAQATGRRRRRGRRTAYRVLAAVTVVAVAGLLVTRPWEPPGSRPVPAASDSAWGSLQTWPTRGDYYPPTPTPAATGPTAAPGGLGSSEHLLWAGTVPEVGPVLVSTAPAIYGSDFSGPDTVDIVVRAKKTVTRGAVSQPVLSTPVVAVRVSPSVMLILAPPSVGSAQLLTGYTFVGPKVSPQVSTVRLTDGVALFPLPDDTALYTRVKADTDSPDRPWGVESYVQEQLQGALDACPSCPAGVAKEAAQQAHFALQLTMGIRPETLRYRVIADQAVPRPPGDELPAATELRVACVAVDVVQGPTLRSCVFTYGGDTGVRGGSELRVLDPEGPWASPVLGQLDDLRFLAFHPQAASFAVVYQGAVRSRVTADRGAAVLTGLGVADEVRAYGADGRLLGTGTVAPQDDLMNLLLGGDQPLCVGNTAPSICATRTLPSS